MRIGDVIVAWKFRRGKKCITIGHIKNIRKSSSGEIFYNVTESQKHMDQFNLEKTGDENHNIFEWEDHYTIPDWLKKIRSEKLRKLLQ